MTIATAAQLASRVQADVDTATAELLLEILEDQIVAEVGVMDPWPARIKGIQLDAAARAYSNPSGLTSESFETYRRSFPTQSGEGAWASVCLTADERLRLRGAAGLSGMWSVRPLGSTDAAADALYPFPGRL